MILDKDKISRIKSLLQFHPRGMSITGIARQLKMNRNSVAKYLEILLMSGQVEATQHGMSKIFSLSKRMPVSALMGFSSNMILMVDNDHRILQVNDRFLKVTGASRDTLIGKRVEEIAIPLIQDLPLDSIKKSDEEKGKLLEKKVDLNGREFFVSIKLISTIFDDGNEGITILIEDITARKQAEAALAYQERQYRSIIEHMQDVFYRTDREGNLILVSPSWASLFGYESDDPILGKNLAEMVYLDPGKRKDFLETLAETGSVTDYEVTLKKKDGTPLYVEATSHFYYDDAGAVLGVEGVIRDVSERRVAAEKIRDYIHQIEFLSGTLLGFIDMPAGADIYERIASDLKVLVPDAIIVVTSYDPATGNITIRHVLDEDAREMCRQVIGRDPVGMILPIDAPGLAVLRTGAIHNPRITFHELVFRALPADTSETLAAAINYGDLYTIGFTRGNDLLGSGVILLKKGGKTGDLTLIETYVHQASIALQRKIAEDATKESEGKYRTLAEAAPDMIFIIGRDDTVRFVNTTAAKSLNLPAEEIIGRSRRQLFSPDIADHQGRSLKVVFDTGKPLRTEQQTQYGSEKYWQDNSLVPLKDENGNISAVLGIARDITGRKKAERAQKILSAIVESTDDAIIGKDPSGTIISWNPAAERLYGYPQDEIIGEHISLIIPPERRMEMDNILLRIRAGESVNSLETLRNKKDGTIIDVSVTISPIIDDDGTVIGASSIARNITQRKTDEQLRDVEERYQSVVENIAVGVYRSTGDPKGKFLWGNPALVQILGYTTLKTLEEVAVADIFVEPDGREKFLLELKKAGFVKNRELLLRKPDGTRITVLVTALLKLNRNGDIEYISGLVEDITKRRQAEQQLQAIQKEILDVVEFLPTPTFIIDNKKKVVAWNRAIEQLTGVTRAEMIGTAGYARSFPFYGTSRPLLIDLIDSPDEDIARYYSNMKRDGATLEAETFCPTLCFGKGATLWGKAAPLMDEEGNRIGAIEIIHEVSDPKPGHVITTQSADAAEAVAGRTAPGYTKNPAGASYANIPALLSRLYLSNALKTAHDGITILDLSARCIWANDALITLVGAQDSDAVVGKSVTEFIVTDLKQSILDRLTAIPLEGPTLFPLQIVTASGPVRVDTSISGISDEEGEILGYMAIFHRSKTHVDRQ